MLGKATFYSKEIWQRGKSTNQNGPSKLGVGHGGTSGPFKEGVFMVMEEAASIHSSGKFRKQGIVLFISHKRGCYKDSRSQNAFESSQLVSKENNGECTHLF